MKSLKILVLNSGSSSIKCQYFIGTESMASLLLERIGEEKSHAEIRYINGKITYKKSIPDHHAALNLIFSMLLETKVLTNIDDLDSVGHRVVHGGDRFKSSVRIDEEVIENIRSLIPLAPLHNPANLDGIEILYDAYPKLQQVAVFDTAFHQSIPEYAYQYPLPYAFSQENHIRRYGFHGTSHAYVAKEAANMLGEELNTLNLITLHLGNGASVTAIKAGKSIDTSMGFTPLEGLMMGTRSGDIDPAIIPYLERNKKMSIQEIDNMLNKESGLKGICGSNDMREVLERAAQDDTEAKLALEMYVYRIQKYIGAYTVALGHVDALVFTGGIGENATVLREMVCDGLYESIGLSLDFGKNSEEQKHDREIQSKKSKIKLLVIATNEELAIVLQIQKINKSIQDILEN